MDAPVDRVARVDQACASFADAARMHAAYFTQLVADGLQRAEALDLTVGYLETLRSDIEDDGE